MTQRFYIPKARVFQNDGSVGVDYKLYFYETLTNTLKDTYSDAALTIPNTNPVIADSSGYFGDIFLSDDNYKVVLKDGNDVTIWTADPQDIYSISLNSFSVRPFTHWGTTSGITSAFTLSPNPLIASYTNTLVFSMQMSLSCIANPTLSIEDLNNPGNFLTAKNLKKYNGASSKVSLEANDLLTGQTYIVRYDGTDFIVLNPELPYLKLYNSVGAKCNIETATCSTASATAAKTATLTNFSLVAGMTFRISFSNTNTEDVPTLNINSLGAKPIADENGNVASATYPFYIKAGTICEFVYDGTNFVYSNRVVKNYINGLSWYKFYTNGWIEQGGEIPLNTPLTPPVITLITNFKDTNYSIILTGISSTGSGSGVANYGYTKVNSSSFAIYKSVSGTVSFDSGDWEARGF